MKLFIFCDKLKKDALKNIILCLFYIQTQALMMEDKPAAETSFIHYFLCLRQ